MPLKFLLDPSRARLIALLRHGGLTARDLASELHVTTNAVRDHLSAMRRDGIVRLAGQRRGTTRPFRIFELTPDVEQLLSPAYVPFVGHLVRVVGETLPARRLNRVMRDVGKGLANELGPQKRPGQLGARVSLASQLLNEHLGAVTTVERNGKYVIRGTGCPLAAVTGKNPSVCLAIASFVAGIVESPVREQCDRAARPRCCFEISATSFRAGAPGFDALPRRQSRG